jgi:hypothetical protein
MASGHVTAQTGRTHGCTDQPANVKKSLANSEPSTHGTLLPRANPAACPQLAKADLASSSQHVREGQRIAELEAEIDVLQQQAQAFGAEATYDIEPRVYSEWLSRKVSSEASAPVPARRSSFFLRRVRRAF